MPNPNPPIHPPEDTEPGYAGSSPPRKPPGEPVRELDSSPPPRPYHQHGSRMVEAHLPARGPARAQMPVWGWVAIGATVICVALYLLSMLR